MAKHDVLFTVPERPVGNADIEFLIKRNGKRYGTVRISKGAIEWIPRDKRYGSKFNWKQFNNLLMQAKTGHWVAR